MAALRSELVGRRSGRLWSDRTAALEICRMRAESRAGVTRCCAPSIANAIIKIQSIANEAGSKRNETKQLESTRPDPTRPAGSCGALADGHSVSKIREPFTAPRRLASARSILLGVVERGGIIAIHQSSVRQRRQWYTLVTEMMVYSQMATCVNEQQVGL